MLDIGTAKRLGDSWFLVSDSERYEIPVNDVWRLNPIEGQRYRFCPGIDGWARGKSIELIEAGAKTIGEYFRDRWFETQIKSHGEDRTLTNAEMPFMLWLKCQGLLDNPIDDLPELIAKYESTRR